jgi:hypothetical protein
VALTGKVLSQYPFAGAKPVQGTITQSNLDCSAQRNHILTPGRVMPINESARRHPGEDYALCRLNRCLLADRAWRKGYSNFFKMRLLVVARIETEELHIQLTSADITVQSFMLLARLEQRSHVHR